MRLGSAMQMSVRPCVYVCVFGKSRERQGCPKHRASRKSRRIAPELDEWTLQLLPHALLSSVPDVTFAAVSRGLEFLAGPGEYLTQRQLLICFDLCRDTGLRADCM